MVPGFERETVELRVDMVLAVLYGVTLSSIVTVPLNALSPPQLDSGHTVHSVQRMRHSQQHTHSAYSQHGRLMSIDVTSSWSFSHFFLIFIVAKFLIKSMSNVFEQNSYL